MTIQLPEKVNMIIRELQAHGFDAYAVGGCIRDSILGREPNDWDITTDARPEQVKAIFHRTVDTGIQHGTVTVLLEREGFEVTTYRVDGEYEDARHPKSVTFTASLLEDLKRRDFTINAMAYNDRTGLVDAFDGIGDLKRRVIRCVGSAAERFEEDALRMMRAVRFAAQLNCTLEEGTAAAIRQLAPNLARISAERIRTELVKLLLSPHPELMREVYDSGMADVFLPEFSRMMQTEQNNPHHLYSVGEHTVHAICAVEPEPVLRLTMLLHDVAKPSCRTTDAQGIDHFHGHPEEGARMTREILRRLKFDNDTIARVSALVRIHDDRPFLNRKNVRRAINRNGIAQYPALFAVQRADTLAQSAYRREEKLRYIEEYETLYRQILEQGQCVSLKELAVNGSDLIEAGMSRGKEIGTVLNRMLEDVLEEPERNQREILLERFRQGKYR